MKRQFARVACAGVCLLISSSALLAQPAPGQGATQPEFIGRHIDRTVPYPMDQVFIATRQALATYSCSIKKERPDYVECQIDRRNEEVTVRLSTAGSETRVEISTGDPQWYRRFDEKTWSGSIFAAMISALRQPHQARGARVRVTAADIGREPLIGTIQTLDESTLTVVKRGGLPVTVPRELITRLEKSASRKRHALQGFLIGATVGAVLGSIPSDCGSACVPRGVIVPLRSFCFGAYGSLIGYYVRTEKWVEMPLDQVRVGLRSLPSGQGGSLTLTFTY